MRRGPRFISRRRYSALIMRAWDRRDVVVEQLREAARKRGETFVHGIPPYPDWGDAIGGCVPRGVTPRQRRLMERRVLNCAHAHIVGGGQGYEGEWQDWNCSDCGEEGALPLARVIREP